MYRRVNQRPVQLGGIDVGITAHNPEYAAKLAQQHARGTGKLVYPGATLAAHQSGKTNVWDFAPTQYNRRP